MKSVLAGNSQAECLGSNVLPLADELELTPSGEQPQSSLIMQWPCALFVEVDLECLFGLLVRSQNLNHMICIGAVIVLDKNIWVSSSKQCIASSLRHR